MLLVFLSFGKICHSQTYVGIQGGVSVSKTPLRLDDQLFTINQSFRHHVFYALNLETHLKKNFYLQTGFQYTKEGATLFKRDLDAPDFYYVINDLKYLRVPVSLKYNQKFSDYLIYGSVGSVIGYSLGGNTYRIMSDNTEMREQITDNIDLNEYGLSTFDAGMLFGLGLEKIIAKKVKLAVGFNYYFGLVNIAKQRDESIFNESHSIFIGASIPLPEKKK